MKYRDRDNRAMAVIMVSIFLALTLLLFASCEDDVCNCEYVTYDDGVETYRSTWDASCKDELLDESVFTYSDGTKSYSRTEIQCK